METGLVAEGLEVLHDLPHVLDRHDEDAGGGHMEQGLASLQEARLKIQLKHFKPKNSIFFTWRCRA